MTFAEDLQRATDINAITIPTDLDGLTRYYEEIKMSKWNTGENLSKKMLAAQVQLSVEKKLLNLYIDELRTTRTITAGELETERGATTEARAAVEAAQREYAKAQQESKKLAAENQAAARNLEQKQNESVAAKADFDRQMAAIQERLLKSEEDFGKHRGEKEAQINDLQGQLRGEKERCDTQQNEMTRLLEEKESQIAAATLAHAVQIASIVEDSTAKNVQIASGAAEIARLTEDLESCKGMLNTLFTSLSGQPTVVKSGGGRRTRRMNYFS